jgi:glycosyltransferase involved in cell wall biosynthesis
VVTKETGIDTENFGFTFRNDSIEEIEHTILSLSQLPPEKLKELSLRTYEIVKAKYSEQAFINRWREILSDILRKDKYNIQ